jgi:hypothetical protein
MSIMTTRRLLLKSAPGAAASLASLAATTAGVAAGTPAKRLDVLFVQSASSMQYDKANGKLTLLGVSPITLFFADRPERIAGNMRTAAFVPFWSEGRNSFLSDPPNADLSIIDGTTMQQVVVVLEDPVLAGDELRYKVKVLQGDMPAGGQDVSLFIDIIGMPLTPMSFAGVRRRAFRRAWIRR